MKRKHFFTTAAATAALATLGGYGRAEHYHHPRHLMLNLLAVERMVEREGRITGLFG